jgi:outer membrane scaffolding protein for murein synthesis (MipA/OmpV family)
LRQPFGRWRRTLGRSLEWQATSRNQKIVAPERRIQAFATLALLIGALPVCADVPPFYALGPRPDENVMAAGVLFFDAPRWAGAEETRRTWRPSATILCTNGFFADPISGIGWNASADKRFEYGLRATLGLGREAVDAAPSLKRVPDTLNVGAFANWNATTRLALQSSVRYGAGGGRDGTLVDLGASLDVLQWDHGSLAIDTSASFASASFMQSYYGVGAGPQWTTVGLTLATPLHRRVFSVFSIDRARLSDKAAASPIVERRLFTTLQAAVSFLF